MRQEVDVAPPTWLRALLTEKFFVTCEQHDFNLAKKKNEKNTFCLDCICGVCQLCVSDHSFHRLLQIRRYVYHDVIRLHDIQKLFDCSRVQTYVINSAKVVFLNERPQPKSSKVLGNNCQSCDRSLQDSYKYCSVACKVEAVFNKQAGGRMKSFARASREKLGHDSILRCSDKESCESLGTAVLSNDAPIEFNRMNRVCDHNQQCVGNERQLSLTSSEYSSANECEFASWDEFNATSPSFNLCNNTNTAAMLAQHYLQYPLDDRHPIANGTLSYKLCKHFSSCIDLSYSPRSVIMPTPLSRRKRKPHRSPLF